MSVVLLVPLLLAVAPRPVGPIEVPNIEGPVATEDPDVWLPYEGPVAGHSPDSPTSAELRILADRVRFTKKRDVVFVEGNVEVHSPPFIVLADSLKVDFKIRQIDAIGRVKIVESNRLLACTDARLEMDSKKIVLTRVKFEIRDVPVPLAQARDLTAEGHSWPGALWLFGDAREVKREQGGGLVLHDAFITPCDCGADPPSWKLSSEHVDVVADHGAWARWPVVHVRDVPVLVLPAWYVPLSPRQSGLLAPQFQLRDGFWLMQPFYLTLGESADTTLETGYVLQRGPRAEFELRWAPAEGSEGLFQVASQWDEKFLASRGEERTSWFTARSGYGEEIYAPRAVLRLVHRTARGRRAAVIDLRLATDRRVAGDFGETLGARVEPYVRSAAQLSTAIGHNVVVGANASGYQDLKQRQLMFFPEPALTPYRAPLFFAHLLPTGAGPVVLEAQADLVRMGFIGDGPASPLVTDSLLSGWRVAAAPRLSLPLRLGDYLRAGIGAGFRQALFAEDFGSGRYSGAMVIDGEVGTDLVAIYSGANSRWRHSVSPFVRSVGVPLVVDDGRGPLPILDERDRYTLTHQVLVGFRNTLYMRYLDNVNILKIADVTLAQGVDCLKLAGGLDGQLDPRKAIADTVLLGSVDYKGLSSRLLLAADPANGRIGALISALRLEFPNSLVLGTSYNFIGSVPADLLYAANHELFGDTAIPVPTDSIADRVKVAVGYSPIEVLRLSYSADIAMLASTQKSFVDRIMTHGGKVVYHSSCECWEAGVQVRFWPDRATPDIRGVLMVSGFGEQISIF